MDWNLILNVAALVAIGFATLRVGATRRHRDTIADLNVAIDAKEKRIQALEGNVVELGERADSAEAAAIECEKGVVKWEARYEELSRYAAKPAVEHFERLMREHRDQVAERHERIIAALALLEGAQRSQGELVLQVLSEVSGPAARGGG